MGLVDRMDAEDGPLAEERVADAVQGAEASGGFGVDDALRALWRTARHTPGVGRRAGRLGAELARVGAGRSSIEAPKRDWRFKDETWSSNPVYRRVMQSYLACGQTLTTALADADVDWRDSERAGFLLEILISGVAPTNFLAGNPAALKHAFETGGLSLAKGARRLVSDLVRNGGMPQTVDASGFAVGENLAATPGAVVCRDEVCEVLQYAPSTPETRTRPVLIVPPQINKYYFMDLAPGPELRRVCGLPGPDDVHDQLAQPRPASRLDWDFDIYAARSERAIDAVRDVTGSDDVNLLALCAGGILTSTVLNHLAAGGDSRVRSASFASDAARLRRCRRRSACSGPPRCWQLARRKISARAASSTARALGAVFTWMRPNDLVWNYWVNNYLMGKDPPRLRHSRLERRLH